MDHTIVEMILATLILASIVMGVAFIFFRKQGKTFVTAFDKAFMWGSGLFVTGSLLSTIVYVA